MLRSHLCDYSDAYIIAKGRIGVRGTNDVKKEKKDESLKIKELRNTRNIKNI